MASLAPPLPLAKPTALWAGRALSALFVLFMVGASIAPKLLGMQVAADALAAIGWPTRHVLTIGLLELAFVILYAVPRTSVLGAVLMTGLLGGAIGAHVRADSPLFSHALFGIYLAVLMWGGLWLRSGRVRALLPLSENAFSEQPAAKGE